jgi:hypothetical protein
VSFHAGYTFWYQDRSRRIKAILSGIDVVLGR